MLRDKTAMIEALLARDLPANRILPLHGRLDRPLVTAFLQTAGLGVARRNDGSVFVHFNSHGFFDGDTAAEARPQLLFSSSKDVADEDRRCREDFFIAFVLPAEVG